MGAQMNFASYCFVLFHLYIVLLVNFTDGTDNRIVGGRPAEEGEFPYQVSLRRSYNDKHFCGGSLITENHVLSAAHCMYYQWGGVLPPIVVSVVAGQLNITMKDDTVFRNVSQITIHPKFNKTSMENDVAILKLTSSMPVTHFISTIPIAQYDNDHKLCIVSGWGVQEFTSNEISESLLATEVTRISNERCDDMYGNGTIMPSMLCAHDEAGEHDACQGDSGGPLVCSGLLIGVISTGEGCANKLYPGIYANISYLYDWIYENVYNVNSSQLEFETESEIQPDNEFDMASTFETIVTNRDDKGNHSDFNHFNSTENYGIVNITTSKHFNTANEREYNTSSTSLNGESLVKDNFYNGNSNSDKFGHLPDQNNSSSRTCHFEFSAGLIVLFNIVIGYWDMF